MTSAGSRFAALIRCLPLLAVVHLLPAAAMDVELTFVLPKGVGELEARFTGFDNNDDGWISSADNEVTAAWSSSTGPWQPPSGAMRAQENLGFIDIKYSHSPAVGIGDGYLSDVFLGLARFTIETKSQTSNHVNSNGLKFRGESKFGFFSMYGLSWSDLYNAPSSYSYTFEGPEHQVQLALSATGSPFLPAVPESATVWLLCVGLFAMLLYRRASGDRRMPCPGA